MKNHSIRVVILVWLIASAASLVAQTQNATGTPKFGSFGGGPDVINLGNLNVHLNIPVYSRSGRGIPFYYNFSYDSTIWSPVVTGGVTEWQPVGGWGWQSQTDAATGYVPAPATTQRACPPGLGTGEEYTYRYSGFVDSLGTFHHTPLLIVIGGCGLDTGSVTKTADDGSGYQVTVPDGIITSRGGKVWYVPVGSRTSAAHVTDTNGNQITTSSGTTFYDTLSASTPVLTISGTNPTSYAYVAPSGANASYKINYGSYNVKTNFGCTGVTEYTLSAASLVSSVSLPDGSAYTFTYEPTPSHSGYVTGRLASVTLPTGGTITYTYKTEAGYAIECADGTTAGLTRVTPDGTWNYDRTLNTGTSIWTTKIVDPQSNETDISFSEDANNYFYETNRVAYQGSSSGSQLLAVTTCYNGTALSSCPTAAVAAPINELNVYRNFNGGSNARVDTTFNTLGLPTEMDEYDFGGTALRKTSTIYASLGSGIDDRPASITVRNGSGTQTAETSFAYDQTGVTGTTGTPQHISVGSVRGNVTTVTNYTSPTATLSRSFSYYDTGLVNVATDVNGQTTTNTYGACGNSFLTGVSLPLSLSTSMTWNCSGGVPATSVDPNSKTTTYNYTDSHYWRPSSVVYPDGGETDFTYNTTSTPWSSTNRAKRDSTNYVSTTTLLDGLGRPYEQELTSDPAGTDLVMTAFNSMGQVQSVTNPYRTTSDPTYGSTSYLYDALGRVTTVTHPDSTTVLVSYTKGATQVQDEGNGTSRVVKDYQVDGLGRTTSVCEISAVTQDGNSPTPTSCGQDITATGFPTVYQYDTLNNMTSVTQGGLTRTYVYDQISRLTSESNPESGATIYNYDAGTPGDLYTRVRPEPNQPNSSTKVTTTYTFDALHRLTRRLYSDSTPGVGFAYDQTSFAGISGITNSLGRLSGAWVAAGSTYQSREVFSYDATGRPLQNWQCLATGCNSPYSYFAMPYTYDLLGNTMSSSVEGATINYAYDDVSHLTAVTSSYNDATHPSSLLSGTAYNPLGELTRSMSGTNTSSSGFAQAWNYDNRGRTSYYSTSVNGHGTIEIQSGISYAGNGNVLGFADGILGNNWSYGYDDFNRLIGTTQSGGSSNVSYTYDYDRYGNRWHSTLTGGSGPSSTSYSFDTSNHITPAPCGTGFCYDAAGNLTSDTLHGYTYDPEGHMLTVDSSTYAYDAFGRRVISVTGGHTWYYGYDLASRIAWENEDAGWYRGEVYGPKGRLATYKDGLTFFPTQDLTGTVRNNTTQDMGYLESCYSLPFGDGQSCWGNVAGGPAPAFFTGQDRDTESYLDHFWFRQYTSTQGRWTSPDPGGLAVVDATSPQTWNRYAYVMNNPLSYVDPLGLYLPGNPCNDTCQPPWEYGGGSSGGDPNPSGPSSGNSGGGTAANNGTNPIVPANPCNRAGNAPDPSVYQAKGQAASTNAITDYWNLFQFHGHGANDAQQSGASPAYANYVFGVYMSAAGYTLDQALSGADTYAQFKTIVYGPYPASVGPLDAPNHPFTPVSNVMNITYGFNAQQTGTICHK